MWPSDSKKENLYENPKAVELRNLQLIARICTQVTCKPAMGNSDFKTEATSSIARIYLMIKENGSLTVIKNRLSNIH